MTGLTDGAFVVDLTLGGSTIGRSTSQLVPLTATKTWLGYRVSMSPAATNLVGVPHTFTATVEQSEDGITWFPAADGTTLTATTSGPGTIDTAASTCVTGGTAGGTCTYVVTDAGPGTLTLTVTAIAATTVGGLPATDLVVPPVETAKTWVAYLVTVSPSATNAVGAPHVFTITATRSDGDPVDGATVAYTWTGAGTATPATSCTTDTAGVCTVTVTSASPGTGTLTVTGLTDGLFVLDLTQAGTPGQAADQAVPLTASKTWLGYRVSLSPAATNLVGVPHTFTATVEQSADGTTWTPAADGTTLTATTAGLGAIDTATSSCVTGGTVGGTCTYVVTDAGPGTLTLTVTAIAGTTVDGTPVTNLPVTPVETAKTWLAYLVTVSPSATNPVDAPHVFTITATRSDGDPVDGATVAYTWTGAGTPTPPSSCTTDTTGACTVTVTSSTAGAGTLTVTGLTDGAFVVDLTVPGAPGQADTQVVPLTASKTWLGYRVTLDAPATNLVGVPHTFTATVEQSADGNTWTAVPDGTTLTATTSGTGTLDTGTSTCVTGGTTAGTCTYVVTDAGPGTLTVSVTTIAATTVDGVPVADLVVPPVDTSKTWLAYDVTLSPSATNAVGAPHVFTITATRSDGDPVEDASIAYVWTGAGTATPASSCTTDASGVCTVTVTSLSPGTGTLTVTSVLDGAFLVDLTVPGTPGQAASQVVPLIATKTWLAYRVTLDASATNLVGVPHTFTATVEQSADGTTWSAVPDGTTLTASATGTGTLDAAASTCETGGTTTGTCTYVVTDAGPGTLTIDVTAIASTTVDGAPFTNVVLIGPAAASKTWVAYEVTVSGSATNLVDTPHVFTITATRSDSDPVDGATIAYTWTGTGTASPATSCTTNDTGVCTVTVTSSATGTGTLTVTSVTDGAFVVDLTPGGSTVGRAATQVVPLTTSKTWVDYRVTVTPETATNYVDQPHTFTVLVEQDTGAGFAPLPDAEVALAVSGTATPDPPVPTSCTTDAAGQCLITVTSSVPGTLELTATYNATAGSVTRAYDDAGEKEWVPGWTVTVVKESSVADSDQTFSFETTELPEPVQGAFPLAIGGSVLYEGLLPGTYTITELTDAANLPNPWRFESVECTGLAEGASVTYADSSATLTFEEPLPGSAITCTFTNEQMNLRVQKSAAVVSRPSPVVRRSITRSRSVTRGASRRPSRSP